MHLSMIQFSWMSNRISWRTERDLDPLSSRLDAFDPEILIFAGWHIRPYRKVARAFANRSWRVMTMDNCWRATPRQIAGRWIAWVYLLPLAGAVWLPGDRQSIFARRLGFDQQMILHGLYSCDQTAMEAPHIARVTTNRPVPRSFLFLGRFVPEKRTDMLLKAYELYRDNTLNPWPLVCCGAGPLKSELEGKRGIQVKGFVQPERIPEVLASAGSWFSQASSSLGAWLCTRQLQRVSRSLPRRRWGRFPTLFSPDTMVLSLAFLILSGLRL